MPSLGPTFEWHHWNVLTRKNVKLLQVSELSLNCLTTTLPIGDFFDLRESLETTESLELDPSELLGLFLRNLLRADNDVFERFLRISDAGAANDALLILLSTSLVEPIVCFKIWIVAPTSLDLSGLTLVLLVNGVMSRILIVFPGFSI